MERGMIFNTRDPCRNTFVGECMKYILYTELAFVLIDSVVTRKNDLGFKIEHKTEKHIDMRHITLIFSTNGTQSQKQ